jgi:hypothetical protein
MSYFLVNVQCSLNEDIPEVLQFCFVLHGDSPAKLVDKMTTGSPACHLIWITPPFTDIVVLSRVPLPLYVFHCYAIGDNTSLILKLTFCEKRRIYLASSEVRE